MIWRLYEFMDGHYYGEKVVNGMVVETRDISAHCLACAKSDLMAKTGEPADIRGWHLQGNCGAFLKAMRITIDTDDNKDYQT